MPIQAGATSLLPFPEPGLGAAMPGNQLAVLNMGLDIHILSAYADERSKNRGKVVHTIYNPLNGHFQTKLMSPDDLNYNAGRFFIVNDTLYAILNSGARAEMCLFSYKNGTWTDQNLPFGALDRVVGTPNVAVMGQTVYIVFENGGTTDAVLDLCQYELTSKKYNKVLAGFAKSKYGPAVLIIPDNEMIKGIVVPNERIFVAYMNPGIKNNPSSCIFNPIDNSIGERSTAPGNFGFYQQPELRWANTSNSEEIEAYMNMGDEVYSLRFDLNLSQPGGIWRDGAHPTGIKTSTTVTHLNMGTESYLFYIEAGTNQIKYAITT